MKTKLAIALTVVVMAVVAAVVVNRTQRYEIVRPKPGDITEAVYGLGRVKTDKRFQVIVGVMSTVTRRHVNEGDLVRKGAPLIEFESRALFRAPFEGTVTLASLNVGETALPHAPTLTLEDLKSRFIEVSLEQQAALRVKKGQLAKVSLESVRGQVLTGTVGAIYPKEDEFIARILVEGLDSSVLPGMTADVAVEIGKIRGALLVPLKAIPNGVATIKQNGGWQKRKVSVGHVDGLFAEIRDDGITPDSELRMSKGD